jgi:hypothetical protein
METGPIRLLRPRGRQGQQRDGEGEKSHAAARRRQSVHECVLPIRRAGGESRLVD